MILGVAVFVFLKLAVRAKKMDTRAKENTQYMPRLLSRLLATHPTPSVEVLVVVIGTVSVASSIAMGLNLPFLMVGVIAGVLIANFHTQALFDSLKIDNVMPLFNLVFFALIGANIHLDSLFSGDAEQYFKLCHR